MFKKEGYWGVVPQIKMYHFLYVASRFGGWSFHSHVNIHLPLLDA